MLSVLGCLCACRPVPMRSDANPNVDTVGAPAAEPSSLPRAKSTEIQPNPLVSRGKHVEASGRFSPPAKAVVDGEYKTYGGTWNVGRVAQGGGEAWVAIDVGVGPRRLLLLWSAAGSYNYNETDYGSPGSYRIETSADSGNGADGTWTVVATVEHVSAHAAERAFDFNGQRWVRFVVTGAPPVSPNGVQIDEIDLHDVSAGAEDTWFFMGDSITAFAFDRQTPTHQPSFAALVHERHAGHFPAIINGGIGGDKSDEGLERLDAWLTDCPDMKHWALAYGTNDAAGNVQDPSHFKHNMQTMVDHLRKAGRIPVLAKIPFATDHQHDHLPRFNDVIDEINAANSLTPGPDLYAWFWAHPEDLRDGLHPTDRGIVAINRLWADAMSPLYPR
jgi:acyl-CoA thioesterase-1